MASENERYSRRKNKPTRYCVDKHCAKKLRSGRSFKLDLIARKKKEAGKSFTEENV